MVTRRSALKKLACAGVGLPLLARAAPLTEKFAPLPGKPAFRLGVASVSLKSLPLDNALAAVRRVGLDAISLHRAHAPWESTAPAWLAVAQKIKAAEVELQCCGVLYLRNDESEMRRMFDYVRALGVPRFTCSPEPAALPLLEKFVQEYDVRAAIHNHTFGDQAWRTPTAVWQAIQPLDSRIGLCLDVGHSFRAGEDPVEAIRQYLPRLDDLHLKDSLSEVGAEDIPVEMGRGRLDLRGILAALIEVGYAQGVWFEYEKDPNDPVPGLAESVGYIRGLLKSQTVV